MRVRVTNINIPAWSTVGFGKGVDENGEDVKFVGDHRAMLNIGRSLGSDEPVEVELEDWQVVT